MHYLFYFLFWYAPHLLLPKRTKNPFFIVQLQLKILSLCEHKKIEQKNQYSNMPTLQFKGKNIIWNHHLAIPYHTLDEIKELDFSAPKVKDNGNLIIEGDNLIALKALLPIYTGKIDCICIDPPYNTGNEGWVYNDKVNSPLINEWIGKAVGLDDLTRHDKWLCMMAPRLKLLQELLSDKGSIFISIDDNEDHKLRMIMDEIFGEQNFVAVFIRRRRKTQANLAKNIAPVHEYAVCYCKNIESFDANKIPYSEEFIKKTFSNPDKDPKGPYQTGPLARPENSSNKEYTLIMPNGREIKAKWSCSQETFNKYVEEKRLVIPRNGEGMPRIKIYQSELEGQIPNTWWDDVATNDEASKEIEELFGTNAAFTFPKPTGLIKKILQLASNKNSIILDSFSGSGTTGHAVLDLNKEDGGNRKFILVQMTEETDKEPEKNICKDVTRERIKRAIEKYDYKSGFKYLRVGIPLDAESMLDGKLPTYQQFAKYVYYLCTGENLADTKAINEKKYFVGIHGNAIIYLVYKQNYEELTRLALNLTLAEQIKKDYPKKKVIVYAPACFLDEEYLEENQIQFVSIPYNLFQRNN